MSTARGLGELLADAQGRADFLSSCADAGWASVLAEAAWALGRRLGSDREPVIRALERAVDPPEAAAGLLRMLEAWDQVASRDAPAPPLQALLIDYIWSASKGPYLRNLFARDPWALASAAVRAWAPLDLAGLQTRFEALLAAGDDDRVPQTGRALRTLKQRESARIFGREAKGADVAETTAELSQLADFCVTRALAACSAALQARLGTPTTAQGDPVGFVVMAMGKHGGQELNFSSDIDLVFAYETDDAVVMGPDGAPTRLSVHELFVRLGRSLMATLGDVTADGYVFRVDMRLRPGGARGPLAHSVDALVDYYESWGATWQRAVWLKARPVAGDLGLGARLLEALEPFVFRKYLDLAAIGEIAAMKERVEEMVGTPRPHAQTRQGWDVKAGRGGIREIEFVAQALQLVYGGQRPELRARSTLSALERLTFSGILSHAESHALASAYRLFRRVEHHVQVEDDRQTHRVPLDNPEAMERLARRLDAPSLGLAKAGAAPLSTLIEEHRAVVSATFERLLPAEAGAPREPLGLDLDLVDPATEANLDRLRELGFIDPTTAARQLGLLAARPYLPFHRGSRGAELRELMLVEVLASPDPDQALANLTRLLTRVGTQRGYLDLLLANPMLVRLLVTLFGTSDFLSKRLASQPEQIERLARPGWLSTSHQCASLTAALSDLLGAISRDDRERRLNALRRFKSDHILRIALRDVAGLSDVVSTRSELTDLAEVLVGATLSEAEDEMRATYGVVRDASGAPVRVAIMALGKLGSGELSYASDLDLVFLYESDGVSDGHRSLPAQTWFSRLAQKLMTFMSAHLREGRLYVIDTRLRPSGNQGALVTQLTGYAEYMRQQAHVWERQALLRARWIAGDPALEPELEALRRDVVFPPVEARPLPSVYAEAVRKSRARFDEQITTSGTHDVKYDPGGLVDVELAVQLLQLIHGPEHAELRRRHTLDALAAARSVGVLDAAAARVLGEGYRFLTRLEDRLRIVRDQGVDQWHREGPDASRLARRMGYEGERAATELARDYDTHAMAVRGCLSGLLTDHGAGSAADG